MARTDSAVLRGILKDVRDKKILSPIIRGGLADPKFKGFSLQVEGWTPRPYDGWFHPSTHATWDVDKLVDYLTHPERYQPDEHPSLSFVLAVTQGKFWHTFHQRLLLDHGILLQDEVPLVDIPRRRKGHTDGLLANGELLEIKTSSSRSFRKFTDLEGLMTNEPGYYAQTQDYLDMAEAEHMRYLVMCMESPYAFSEFLVPVDGAFQARQRRKYREAVEIAMQHHQLPTITAPVPQQSRLHYGTPLH